MPWAPSISRLTVLACASNALLLLFAPLPQHCARDPVSQILQFLTMLQVTQSLHFRSCHLQYLHPAMHSAYRILQNNGKYITLCHRIAGGPSWKFHHKFPFLEYPQPSNFEENLAPILFPPEPNQRFQSFRKDK